MSAARRVSKEQPVPAISSGNFQFPSNSHLLITSPSKIFSWDLTGINTIFRSSKGGIVAARETKDGSGMLAIADKQVVVLHDTKRGQERSWGLEAEQDEVRHLEYTADAKSLFLSTHLTADIQRYSTERSRLLDPTNIHASPPVALALSPTGHVMVSASDHPPTVYLKNLAHNSSPILIEPRVSRAAVSVIAFHPERANIFLMAFRDGSVAAYDSTRIGRHQGGQFADQQGVSHGQLSSFMKLHRATTEASKLAAITGAAFLPGFRTRAVTVGSDGRCRVIDFAGRGEILRTWHAKAPVTSVSVLSLKDQPSLRSPFARNRASHTIGGPTSTDSVLAIGRADGAVHLYDSVGLLLEQRHLGEDGERIISVEWVKGSSPRPISETVVTSSVSQAPSVPAKRLKRKLTVQSQLSTAQLDLTTEANAATTIPPRQFTVHPDEAEASTVRHTPRHGTSLPPAANNGIYLDLFSPVKPAAATPDETTKQRVASPPRSRPRVSSQTFIKSPEPGRATDERAIAGPRNIALFPSTDDTDDAVSPRSLDHDLTSANAVDLKLRASAQKQRITWKPSERRRSRKSIGLRTVPARPNNNAKVLADIRKMSTARTTEQAGRVLSAFGAAQTSQGSGRGKRTASTLLYRPTEHIETDLESHDAFREYDSARRERRWVEDSEQGDAFGGDIWLTSDSEEDTTRRGARRRKPVPVERPPARQTSKSRITSHGTVSTFGKAPALEPTTTLGIVDGSTEDDDEGMQTARSRVSLSGKFSPSSSDVRQLFPRSSSLSPRKHKNKPGSAAKRSQRRPKDSKPSERRTLREMTLNTAHTRQPNSPWTKLRTSKASVAAVPQIQPLTGPDMSINEAGHANGTVGTSEGENAELEPHCAVCGPTQARVIGLECEVARLRGEVLALKAVLRRNGLQLPMGR